MKLFGRNDPPERAVGVTSEEYERLMKTMGRLDAQVESLELKWTLWKKEGDRLLARIERRDQRAAKKTQDDLPRDDPDEPDEITRRIQARRGHAVSR